MLSLPIKSEPSIHSESPPQRDRGFRILRGMTVEDAVSVAPLRSDKQESIAIPDAAIWQQLDHMLQSRVFIQSEKLSQFLRFIVEHVLAGNQKSLKEYVIGSEVYDRKPPYHPSQDSIVRTEARRLRGKLKEYYENEGMGDPVFVYLRPGSYAPVFQSRETLAGARGPAVAASPAVSAKTSSIVIAILPFSDISQSIISTRYARGVPDELAYTLMRTEGCKVVSPFSMAHCCAQEKDVAAVMRKVGADVALEGSVRADGNHIRVTASAVDSSGSQLWVKRVDADVDLRTRFTIEEKIAFALSGGLSTLFSAWQRRSLP